MSTRQMTKEECQLLFLNVLNGICEYWSSLKNKTIEEKVRGAVFSVLVALDGENGELPAFCVEPQPHPDDKQYDQDNNRNWWSPLEGERPNDIAGNLHELFLKTYGIIFK